ncbi:hypothetical protein B7G68_17085 [Caulobacter segnis]|nr:hypothetical protein B7G68_17085 [Caulobacter segnis]
MQAPGGAIIDLRRFRAGNQSQGATRRRATGRPVREGRVNLDHGRMVKERLMPFASQTRPFDPRARRPRQWPLGVAVFVAAVLNAIVWGGLLSVARAFLGL